MYQKSAEKTCALSTATLIAGAPEGIVKAFTNDTRSIAPGSCFICFVGETQDGNNFVLSAFEKGAGCVVMTRAAKAAEIEAAKKAGGVILRAYNDDPYAFLQALARAFRNEEGWLTVAITGSVGKTTTRQMTLAALSPSFKAFANEGNFNSAIGVPLTILNAPAGKELFVCEMGMDRVGEIDQIASAALPNVGCITNVGTAHIGILGSQENIARAKAEMVHWLGRQEPVSLAGKTIEPMLLLDVADKHTSFIEKTFAEKENVATRYIQNIGEAAPPQVNEKFAGVVGCVKAQPDGSTSFIYRSHSGTDLSIECPLLGLQMVDDAMFALGLADYLGADLDKAAAALKNMHATSLRAEIKQLKTGGRLIDDSYNANAASMTAALDLLENMSAPGEKIAVLGEMGELGDSAEELHREVGAYAAQKAFSRLIFVGERNAEIMYEAAIAAGEKEANTLLVNSAHEAISQLSSILNENQKAPVPLMLVKGSRFLHLDQIAKELCK